MKDITFIDLFAGGGGTSTGAFSVPDSLKEQIKEESIKFLQRCKRHCERSERKLTEKLEDLE
jgi:hypothetical protein